MHVTLLHIAAALARQFVIVESKTFAFNESYLSRLHDVAKQVSQKICSEHIANPLTHRMLCCTRKRQNLIMI